jgi:hypothetical protein
MKLEQINPKHESLLSFPFNPPGLGNGCIAPRSFFAQTLIDSNMIIGPKLHSTQDGQSRSQAGLTTKTHQATPKRRQPKERKFIADIPRSTLSPDSSIQTKKKYRKQMRVILEIEVQNKNDATNSLLQSIPRQIWRLPTSQIPFSTKKSGKQIHPGNLFVILNRI